MNGYQTTPDFKEYFHLLKLRNRSNLSKYCKFCKLTEA
ncbi:hypothetical protein [Klebsiella phage KL01]|uniref:Uncharacterized protein n=1 Tax=Klebsiella phage KL01 TaxID=3077152 RepID=A0AA96T6W5_9CAUD|nr:hypothetical protein [Klebsiella phage KL01]